MLGAEIVPVSTLSESRKKEMHALFAVFFPGVSYTSFRADLGKKTHAILFVDRPRSSVAGFTMVTRTRVRELTGHAGGVFVFSGGTVIDHPHRDSPLIQRAFFHFLFQTKLRAPLEPLYWMLVGRDLETHRKMRKTFPHSYARHDGDTPGVFRPLIDGFYERSFGRAYAAATGLIRGRESACLVLVRLRDLFVPMVGPMLRPRSGLLARKPKAPARTSVPQPPPFPPRSRVAAQPGLRSEPPRRRPVLRVVEGGKA
jgi:hypothetical protein